MLNFNDLMVIIFKQVILGGGRMKFLPENVVDSEEQAGQRKDGKNLPDIWKNQKTDDGKNGVNATYIESGKGLKSVDPAQTDSLLGLFASDHIAYFHEQEQDDDPTLTDMTEKAIQILSKNPNGFFLFVEGKQINKKSIFMNTTRYIHDAINSTLFANICVLLFFFRWQNR